MAEFVTVIKERDRLHEAVYNGGRGARYRLGKTAKIRIACTFVYATPKKLKKSL